MDIIDAYELTLDVAQELRDEGVKVEVTPREYDGGVEGDLPIDKWVGISFHFKGKTQANAVKEAANYLGALGIAFDTGGMKGARDWEIDWSFRVSDAPDPNWKEAREIVEEMIEGDED